MNKKQLIKTIEELNELLVDPDGPEDPMSTEGTEDELCAILIKEALRLIEPADKLSDGTKTLIQELCDGHLDEMDAKTIEVLERCGYEFSDPDEGEEEAPEDAPEDDDNLELVAEVNGAERLKDLKEIAKSYDEFKSIRGELSAYKTADELREAMLEHLEEEPEEKKEEKSIDLEELVEDAGNIQVLKKLVGDHDEFKSLRKKLPTYKEAKPLRNTMLDLLESPKDEKEEPPTKTEKKATPKKEEKVKPVVKKKGTGVIATIVSLIEKSGKKGITKDEILEQLVEAFPDREKVSMKNTINVQVPNRITKEKFPVKVKDGYYSK